MVALVGRLVDGGVSVVVLFLTADPSVIVSSGFSPLSITISSGFVDVEGVGVELVVVDGVVLNSVVAVVVGAVVDLGVVDDGVLDEAADVVVASAVEGLNVAVELF